jgi:hypothetical protein
MSSLRRRAVSQGLARSDGGRPQARRAELISLSPSLLTVTGTGIAHRWLAPEHLEDPGSNQAMSSCALPPGIVVASDRAGLFADLTGSAKDLRRPCPGRRGRPR